MSKFSKIFGLINSINRVGGKLDRKEFILSFSQGATDSLNGLSDRELSDMENVLQAMVPKPVFDQQADRCRKAIIAIYRSIGKSTAYAITWAEKNGTGGVKKPFNDYTVAELMKLIRVAERIKADYIKKVNKGMRDGL
jgi:hypothetical protein